MGGGCGRGGQFVINLLGTGFNYTFNSVRYYKLIFQEMVSGHANKLKKMGWFMCALVVCSLSLVNPVTHLLHLPALPLKFFHFVFKHVYRSEKKITLRSQSLTTDTTITTIMFMCLVLRF